jgi:hypothetical protein
MIVRLIIVQTGEEINVGDVVTTKYLDTGEDVEMIITRMSQVGTGAVSVYAKASSSPKEMLVETISAQYIAHWGI